MKRYLFVLIPLLVASGETQVFEGRLQQVRNTSDSNTTAFYFSVRTDNPSLHEINVLCDRDSLRVLRCAWMTKGGYPINLPSSGLVLRRPPSDHCRAKITFDRASLKDARESYVTLLDVEWAP